MGARDGQVAMITGGASGFGAAVARTLAGEGMRVCLVDRDGDAATALAEELGGIAVAGDVTDPDTSQQAVADAEQRWGRLDLAFLNAGTVGGQLAVDDAFDLARYRAVVGVNQDAVVYGTVAAVPALRRAGGGDIVATSSLAGLVPIPGDPVYTLTKHAVIGYVRSVGQQLAAEGIRVNAICPGFADTPLIADFRSAFTDAGFPLLTTDDVVTAFQKILAAGTTGDAWFVQPGRESEAFSFRRVPGPRTEQGTPPPPMGAMNPTPGH